MAGLSSSNPLKCILSRQIDDRVDHCRILVDSRFSKSDDLFRKDLLSHYGCVNAIEFSKQGDLIVSGGDDRRVLLWKVDHALRDFGKPMSMRAQHNSNIFCLGYDSSNTKIFSAGNDNQVIVHDLTTGDPLAFFLHEKPVYGLSIHPNNDNVFSSACDDGRVLIFDIREPISTEPFCLAKYASSPFHSVMFNPVEANKLATANAEKGVSMWDIRKPLEPLLRYGLEGATQSCMNVRFNSAGTRLLALKRRLPPVLYAVDSPTLLCHFDQPGYYNSCTMKSCCFAGDDESYVLSGSDNFNLYMWKIPTDSETNWVDSAHMILRGHRSIVNHVRYNSRYNILASSGVEKVIKIWSPFCLGNDSLGGLSRKSAKLEKQRRVFTHDEYLRLVLRSGQFMTHDYSHESTREDPRMMAFFDSLVQREIESWSTEVVSKEPDEEEEEDEEDNEDGEDNNETEFSPIIEQINSLNNSDHSDDSTASDAQLMQSVLWFKTRARDTSGGGVAPERPFGAPNRITRLIGYCRVKLMRLAALENRALSKRTKKINDNLKNNNNESKDTIGNSVKINNKSNGKGVKRKIRLADDKIDEKDDKVVEKTSVGRRKCFVVKLPGSSPIKSKTKWASSESDSDGVWLDITQPSTSSGLSSRRLRSSRYSRRISCPGGRKLSSSSSSSSDDDDDETPVKKPRTADNPKDTYHSGHKKVDKNSNNVHVNGTISQTLTPMKNSIKIPPPTPDSGITSGMSTSEKTNSITRRDDAESSDHERTRKNLESFRKKIDVARKGYRFRSAPVSASDSSD